MAANEFTPWRDKTELLKIHGWLYSVPWSREHDNRRQACSTVSAWKLRGNLPHAVESTALLMEAIIADDPEIHRIDVIRLCYVAALCRFVTGLVDSGQSASHRISMYNKANEIGLPAALVELRHEATHGDIPSLNVLRSAAQRSMLWLSVDYWQRLAPEAPPEEPHAFKDGIEELSERFRGILRRYYTQALEASRRDVNEYHRPPPRCTDEACLELIKICQNQCVTITELAIVLIEWRNMVPSSHELHKLMDDFFPLWDPLIKKLSKHQLCFLEVLTDAMAIQIALPTCRDISTDPYREAITMWLERIFASKLYAPVLKRAKLDYSSILSTCLNSPNQWTIRLAKCIMRAPSHDLEKAMYSDRLEKLLHDQAPPDPCSVALAADDFSASLLLWQRHWLIDRYGCNACFRGTARAIPEELWATTQEAESNGSPYESTAPRRGDRGHALEAVFSTNQDITVGEENGVTVSQMVSRTNAEMVPEARNGSGDAEGSAWLEANITKDVERGDRGSGSISRADTRTTADVGHNDAHAEGGSRLEANTTPGKDSGGGGIVTGTNENATLEAEAGTVEGNPAVGGWQKWTGMWHSKPIGMV